ncbi:MAG: pentapeptide repeat-containing protein [Nitrospira sp.]
MANPEHLNLITRNVGEWNNWIADNPNVKPDLSGANLRNANLRGIDLPRADLRNAKLEGANLRKSDLPGADLTGADLRMADLYAVDLSKATLNKANLVQAFLQAARLPRANLCEANLEGANLRLADLRWANLRNTHLEGANFSEADLSEADLTAATLERAIFVRTTCNKAIFTGCRVYGLAAWDLELKETQQTDLIITPSGQSDLTVDNLQIAQFIYLLLDNPSIRQVIDTITSKVVLILGRFTPERKIILDAIRDKLRRTNYSPVVFDFERPATRDLTETVMTLAGMARFVIADLTDPKSIPHELMSFVKDLPSVPVQPLLLASQKQEYTMFEHLQRYPWVLKTFLYQDQHDLITSLESAVIVPAEQKAKDQRTAQPR